MSDHLLAGAVQLTSHQDLARLSLAVASYQLEPGAPGFRDP